jgi:hypothetical protein
MMSFLADILLMVVAGKHLTNTLLTVLVGDGEQGRPEICGPLGQPKNLAPLQTDNL